MKTGTLGICMLLIFAVLSQTGRLALEITLSVVFVTAFFLTLIREAFERTQAQKTEDSQEDIDEDEADESSEDEMPADESSEDEMPMAA